MGKFADWITFTFKQPLSPMFFFLGVILVLLGITNGFSLPVLNQLASDAGFRWVGLALGIVCFATSVVIYYLPPKEFEKGPRKLGSLIGAGAIPAELTWLYSERRKELSGKQGQILAFLAERSANGEFINQDVIYKVFDQIDGTEFFYRLEHLRLLGFIVRQKIGKDLKGNSRYEYALSLDYIKASGEKG